MAYEYTITCSRCGYRVASGIFPELIQLSNGDVLDKAMHNPGCVVPDNRDVNKISINNTITTDSDAIVSHYTIHYRNA